MLRNVLPAKVDGAERSSWALKRKATVRLTVVGVEATGGGVWLEDGDGVSLTDEEGSVLAESDVAGSDVAGSDAGRAGRGGVRGSRRRRIGLRGVG